MYAYKPSSKFATKTVPSVPIAAYQVSGEYAMIKSPSQEGLLSEGPVLMETLNSIKRAGADMILTYHALEAAKLIKNGY